MDSLRLLTRGSGFKVASNSSQSKQLRPSDGVESAPGVESDRSAITGKRKREYLEDGPSRRQPLSTDEIRRIQQQHKFKIADLRSLHGDHASDNRKAQKEASRLYPQPLQRFSSLRDVEVNSSLLSNLVEQGYRDPTEVQMATIPLMMSSQGTRPDIVTVAPTGSGKTLAFLVPLINGISKAHHDEGTSAASRQVSSIILAPTKELVGQIVNEGRKLTVKTGVRVTAFRKGMRLHEGMNMEEGVTSEESGSDDEDQAASRLVKADVLVSTPLSLLHAITGTASSEPRPLPNVRNLIFDEADILLDPLFREQTLSIWSACTSPNLRTSLWSATIGSNIEELALKTITQRQISLKIAPSNRPALLRCIIGLKDSSLPNITHKLIYASTEQGKLTGLRNLIRPPPTHLSTTRSTTKTTPLLRPPFLIFTQTIPRAQALYNELKYDIPPPTTTPSAQPHPSEAPAPRIAVLHSNLTTPQRTKILQHLRQGKTWIVITTDLLSRGLDLKGLNGVVNYDIPTTSASYVHRAGRTGRAGRQGGVCVTFYTREDVEYLRPIVNVIRKSQRKHLDGGGGGVVGGGGGRKQEDEEKEEDKEMVPKWLLDALPRLSKEKKKELKERGVDVRRGVKESDDKRERRRKGRNTIGTESGYDRKVAERRKGAVEGSRRRKRLELDGGDDDGVAEQSEDEFGGFD